MLWPKEKAKQLDSPNLQLLLRATENQDVRDVDNFLISHLDKRSTYADIAYFIFLALHRRGHTVEALRAARKNLAGDKVYGYSNLLGTLSAIVSHEYFDMQPEILNCIQGVLAEDQEHDFRLKAKLNSAKLWHLNSNIASQATSQQPDPDRGSEQRD